MKTLPKGEYSEGFLKFFDYSISYLKKHNKGLEIHNVSYLIKEGKCGGYCDGEKIVIAGKSSNFCQIFLHEFCHILQIEEDFRLLYKDFYWERVEKRFFEGFLQPHLIQTDC